MPVKLIVAILTMGGLLDLREEVTMVWREDVLAHCHCRGGLELFNSSNLLRQERQLIA